jgi:hypothetical protein
LRYSGNRKRTVPHSATGAIAINVSNWTADVGRDARRLFEDRPQDGSGDLVPIRGRGQDDQAPAQRVGGPGIVGPAQHQPFEGFRRPRMIGQVPRDEVLAEAVGSERHKRGLGRGIV